MAPALAHGRLRGERPDLREISEDDAAAIRHGSEAAGLVDESDRLARIAHELGDGAECAERPLRGLGEKLVAEQRPHIPGGHRATFP
ncbi:hypothetical protein [Bosea sp. BK604]|uniref:hypothetical protein n=1 Tax=Bosea sp. BK604 TaxID=2512180 RepID=UPI001A9F21B6|nr:hypothetical protein [Bosea sp. BK604]